MTERPPQSEKGKEQFDLVRFETDLRAKLIEYLEHRDARTEASRNEGERLYTELVGFCVDNLVLCDDKMKVLEKIREMAIDAVGTVRPRDPEDFGPSEWDDPLNQEILESIIVLLAERLSA